ncbi:MAG TPA: hypothetical protein VFD98_00620 [Terracidiphilus sp.]|jgi:hypothetical protein|nr:hypothetical protein [Terracidiphilus sp.]
MGATLTSFLPLPRISSHSLLNLFPGDEGPQAEDGSLGFTSKLISNLEDSLKHYPRPTRLTSSHKLFISKAKQTLFRITFSDGNIVDIDGVELGRTKMGAMLDRLMKRHGRIRTMTRLQPAES